MGKPRIRDLGSRIQRGDGLRAVIYVRASKEGKKRPGKHS